MFKEVIFYKKQLLMKCCLSLILILGFLPYSLSQSLKGCEEDFIKIIRKTSSSVVKIEVQNKNNKKRISSGIILDNQGNIVTIANALIDYNIIHIVTNRGKKIKAVLIGSDIESNIAIIKIDKKKFKNYIPVQEGNSDKLQVGSFLIAIGNPYGLNRSVSTGIVSGLKRCVWIKFSNIPLTGLIQTTAPVNPGDDGGLVVNSEGKFVGMIFSTINRDIYLSPNYQWFLKYLDFLRELKKNKEKSDDKNSFKKFKKLLSTAPISEFDYDNFSLSAKNMFVSQGINFVLPSKRIYWIAKQIIKHGEIKRGWLGIKVKNCSNKIIITKIFSKSPADAGGLSVGDVLIAFGGKPIKHYKCLLHQISYLLANQKITLKYSRNNKISTVTLKLANIPNNQAQFRTVQKQMSAPDRKQFQK